MKDTCMQGSVEENYGPVQPSDLERVKILSEALPYLQKFRGRTIVVKYGGAAMKDESLKVGVINDLVLLACVGVKPVLVHGGGPEINTWLEKVGIEPEFKNGLRVTGVLSQTCVVLYKTKLFRCSCVIEPGFVVVPMLSCCMQQDADVADVSVARDETD